MWYIKSKIPLKTMQIKTKNKWYIYEIEAPVHTELNRVTRQKLDLDLMTVEYHSSEQPFSLP